MLFLMVEIVLSVFVKFNNTCMDKPSNKKVKK